MVLVRKTIGSARREILLGKLRTVDEKLVWSVTKRITRTKKGKVWTFF